VIHKIPPSGCSAIVEVINDSAQAYKGVIPADVWKDPYITEEELKEELGRGVNFYGWFEGKKLVAVMGIQPVKDVTLLRHAYVITSHQRKGIGKKLLNHLVALVQTEVVFVGTWAAAWWAVQFYEKNGFNLVPVESRIKLRQYWTIPDRQAETSVVLKLEKKNSSLML
jgi:GNAT superfamily N-acetyltransferase